MSDMNGRMHQEMTSILDEISLLLKDLFCLEMGSTLFQVPERKKFNCLSYLKILGKSHCETLKLLIPKVRNPVKSVVLL